MFGVKIPLLAAGAAFALSLLLGILSGIRLPALVLRPVFFAMLFAAISAGVQQVIKKFFSDTGNEGMGERVDISVGDEGGGEDDALAMLTGLPSDDFMSPTEGLDNNLQNGYNDSGNNEGGDADLDDLVAASVAAGSERVDFTAFAGEGGASLEDVSVRKAPPTSFARVPAGIRDAPPEKMADTIRDLLKDG